MFNQNDEEREETHDEDDADVDEENSDEEEDGDDEDQDEDEDSDDSDSDEDSDEDDDKPVSRKELNAALKKLGNRGNANRRVNSKDRDGKDPKGRAGDRRNNSQSPKTEERLSEIEKSVKRAEVLEKKRAFGFEHNLAPKQVDHVFKLTKRPTKKFLEQPHVKAAIDAIGAQSNVRDNTPSGGGRGFKSQAGKSWEKMDATEKQENFVERRRAIIASKR